MQNSILVGRGPAMARLPASEWETELAAGEQFIAERTRFMTAAHWAVRAWTVVELARRNGRPLPAQDIARGVSLPLEDVCHILDELERNLFFLVRNSSGAVSWAFPVTSDNTPHRVHFSTGESAFAA